MQNIITVNEFEILFNKFLNQLRNDKIEKVSIDEDLYWVIDEDQWLDFETEPGKHVGSFAEDLKVLRLIIDGELRPSYIGFERISALLRVVGDKLYK